MRSEENYIYKDFINTEICIYCMYVLVKKAFLLIL